VSSAGLRPKSDCSGKAQKQLYSNLQTRPLVREGATNLQTRKCLKEISKRKKNWSQVPDGRLTPGQTGRLTVGRKLTYLLTYLLNRRKPLLYCRTNTSNQQSVTVNNDSSVGIATAYELDAREVGIRVPVGSRIVTSPCRPDRLWGPPSLSNGYWGLFLRRVKLTTELMAR
jgi:hypothetical protein